MSGEHTLRRKDGTLIGVECNSVANVLPGLHMTINRDTDERKRVEQQLRQAQKMEAVGRLAGGVAHDFNNLLTAITGYSDLMLRRLGEEDSLRSNVEEIRKAASRATALTRQLLAFSRKQMQQLKILNLNSIVSELDKMLQRLIGEDIQLTTTLDPQLGQTKADPGQIEQVIMNLVVNARDAVSMGGKITIETANVYLNNEYVQSHLGARAGRYVMLAVSDTGAGMDDETKSHIFEPFFTTKEAGKGTGLGLATVYGIVKQSNGYISVESEVGQGTAFKVYLPRVDEAAEPLTLSSLAPEKPARRRTETVLLAEDEEVVRNLTRQVLEMNGYKVLEAANGGAALMLCEEHKGPIHLLITDVVMPEMSGRKLAERLSAVRPNMRVLYMSGYTDEAIIRHGVLDEGTEFIQKPFTPESLAHKINELLGASHRESPAPK
jgi:signal transduction histidine kinase/CheY-like chemotaxis protein